MLVDSHCHLDFKDFSSDFEDVLQRAKENDVQVMQTICTKISEFNKIRELVEKYDYIYGSVGNHPNEVEEQPEVTLDQLIELTRHKKIIGIGETGLDYYYENSCKEKQKKSFLIHIEAARITELPIIIHAREADDDIIEILSKELKKGFFKILIHCFTSTKRLADFCFKNRIYISVSGIVTFKNAIELQQIMKDFDIGLLLIETDAPYLAPVPKRGKRNEPSFVKHTAQFIADLKGISFDEVSHITTDNFFKLFNKAHFRKENS